MIDFLVVCDDILQSGELAVMIKPAFRVAPESRERRRPSKELRRAERVRYAVLCSMGTSW